ncbi:Dicer-like protein [Trichinella pseudospiralis]
MATINEEQQPLVTAFWPVSTGAPRRVAYFVPLSVIDALLNFYASGNDRSDAFGFVPRRSSKRVVVFCHHPVVAIRNGGVGYVEIDFIRQRKKE